MWRSNYHEDWERRKTYLIRSLFQDIPVLSPVPEDQESRYGAGSPSDVPPSRPHSPLPPLIIERMPNRHDHPKKFYQDLERKMKILYKKLFLDEGSSSIEDLIKTYGGDFGTSSFIDEFEDYCRDIGTGNASVSTVKLVENRSQCHSFSEQVSPGQPTSDKNVNKSFSDELSSRSTLDGSNHPQVSKDVQSSTQSLSQTQVTTVVEVHKEPSSDHDETLRSHQLDIQISPLLGSYRIGYNKTLAEFELCQEEGNDEHVDDSTNEISRTETSSSVNKETLKEDDQVSSSEISHKSIEIMRRQKENFPSLGSLQNEPIATSCSTRSSGCSNVALRKIFSLDLPEENLSTEDPRNLRESSFSSASVDFSNILTTSTPKLKERSKTKSSSESSETRKRVRRESFGKDEENNFLMVTKRRKCENIAIQTSLISESDADDIDWNQLKKSFFVGVPRIYKLCPCNDHACRDN